MSSVAHWFKSAIADVYWFTIMGRWRRWRIKDVFNDFYDAQPRSDAFRSIFREVFGDEYPAEVDPCGFLTRTDLGNLVKHLRLERDQKLVDLACGRGGSGLWVARETGAQLVGLDIADVAIAEARLRPAQFGLDGRAEFRVGDIVATGYPDATFDAAMSCDSLFLVPDKSGSFQEASRILKPGARFAFTTWEVHEVGGVRDYRPLLENAGFQMDVCEMTPNWEQYQRGVHERILARQDALIQEMGKAAATVWTQFAKIELPKLSHMRRVFIAAHKK